MATIIKNNQVHTSGASRGHVAYDLSDMEGQADEYLESVRTAATKIIQEAREEAVKIRKEAEEAGRKAAEAAVEKILDEKVARQMQTLTPALNQAVQFIEDSRQDWLRHWDTAAIQISCAIAKRIIGRELQAQPEITLEWVTEALRLAAGKAELTIRLNPAEYQTLGKQVEELAKVFGKAAPAKIVADESVASCGCVVATEFGSIDMQLNSQLERLAEELS